MTNLKQQSSYASRQKSRVGQEGKVIAEQSQLALDAEMLLWL